MGMAAKGVRGIFIVIFENRTEIILDPPLSGTSCIVAYKAEGYFYKRECSFCHK